MKNFLEIRILSDEQAEEIVKQLDEVKRRLEMLDADLVHLERLARATGNPYLAARIVEARAKANI